MQQASSAERFRNVALGIAGVVSSVLIPLIGFYYTSRDKEREVSKGFVEIATKILSDQPTDDNKPLREWAIALIDNYSAVRLPDEAREALLNSQSIFEPSTRSGATSRSTLTTLQRDGLTLGIAVSESNGSVEFKGLTEHGVRFAYIRTSSGSRTDTRAAENITRAIQGGLKVGLYHVVSPTSDADSQLANFVERLNTFRWDLPPVIDCEQFPAVTIPPDYSARVEQIARGLEAKFGVRPVIYAPPAFATQHLDNALARYPLFIAQFRPSAAPVLPKGWTDFMFWHLAEGVNDDPALRNYDIIAFKGTFEQLVALNPARK